MYSLAEMIKNVLRGGRTIRSHEPPVTMKDVGDEQERNDYATWDVNGAPEP